MDGADFQGLVAASRSYRRFSGDWLGAGELEALVDAARLAPCGNNMQVVRFRVVSGREACESVLGHLRWAALLRDWDGPSEDEQPRGYVVACLPDGLSSNPIRLIDVGIAAQTMALAACARGLGCCMLRSFDDGLAGDLGLPEGLTPALVLAVGARGERVRLEGADTDHGLAYWRASDGTHCVPKLGLKDRLA